MGLPLQIFFISTHWGISNNYCNTAVAITLPPSPLLLKHHQLFDCCRASCYVSHLLLVHCYPTESLECRLPYEEFPSLSLNQHALVVRGCIKMTIEHALWQAHFTSKQCLDERIPAAWNHLHAIRKRWSFTWNPALHIGIFCSWKICSQCWLNSRGEKTFHRNYLSSRHKHLRNKSVG